MALATLVQQNEVSDVEWATRCDLAALYRIFDNMRMTDLVYTHLSARVPDDPDCFLMNQYGEMFDEVTASSLVKMDLDGNMKGKQGAFNSAGFTIHSACYLARQNVNAVIHLHTKASIAVASVKNGLIPMSQHSLYVINDLAYHDYEGVALEEGERARLVADLGDANFFMLRNHGLLTVGPTVADAFLEMYLFEAACTVQIRALSGGGETIHIPQEILAGAQRMQQQVTHSQGAALVWPGLLRRLDRENPGYAD